MLNNLLLGQTAEEKLYVEDVFSTYLYTGTGSSQTITTGVDLSANSGMVWIKGRSGATDHAIYDTVRGVQKDLVSNSTAAETTQSTGLTAFSSTGVTIGALAKLNTSAATYSAWTFRKAAKFFDVVTYTGNAVSGRQISHNLGVSPGMIIIRNTSTAANWAVYHTSVGNTSALFMNANSAQSAWVGYFNNTSPTDNTFTLGDDASVNASGGLYIAYLFAHDATADGVVQCGAYTGNGSASGPTVNLGWEPQFIIIKKYNVAGDWQIFDNMRGIPTGSADPYLFANTSAAEATTNGDLIDLTPTGFVIKSANAQVNENGRNFIYLAIRRGPMRAPTDATKVFDTATGGGTSTGNPLYKSATVPYVDASIQWYTPGYPGYPVWGSRLQGPNMLTSSSAAAETTDTTQQRWDYQSGMRYYASGGLNTTYGAWMLRRAPGFFDVVCYTGTGSARTVSHNLGVAPELMIVKVRNTTNNWSTYISSVGPTKVSYLNLTGVPLTDSSVWNNTNPTSTAFTVATASEVNGSGNTYVAYLFASCPGVSKVGSYTGTGTTKQIDCGFTNGARFVLIKRTDSTGDWTIWDTARGIVSGNDPYLLLNSTAAEVTNTDYIDPLSTGFEISSTAPAAINANGGTFVFLAIA